MNKGITALLTPCGYHAALVDCAFGKDKILPAFRLSDVNEGVTSQIIAGFVRHCIHIPRLGKKIRCGLVPVPLLVKMSICLVWIITLLTTLSDCGVLQKRQDKLNISMVCLDNLMYRCKY